MGFSGIAVGSLQCDETPLQPMALDHRLKPALRLSGGNPQQPAVSRQCIERLERPGKEWFMMIGLSPQGEERVLVALSDRLMTHRIFVGAQAGNRLDQRQADDPPNGFGLRFVDALDPKGKAHGGNDVVLAIDQGSIDIENGKMRGSGHRHPD